MSVNYKEFLSEVRVDVPGCPNPYIIDYIRKATIKFCELTHIWKKELNPIPLQTDVAIYDFVLDDGESLLSLHKAIRDSDGKSLELQDYDYMDLRIRGDWRIVTAVTPSVLIIENRNQFRIYPIPTSLSEGNVKLHAIMKPSRDSFEVPDFMFEEHVDAIAAGAKKMLLMMAGQSWFNPKQASYFTAQFNNDVGIAKSQARKSYGRQELFAPMLKI